MPTKRPSKNAAKPVLAARVAAIAAKSVSDTFKHDAVSDEAGKSGRRAPREPKYRQGVLTLKFGERLQVTVKDLSNAGARVEFIRKVTLTDEVDLSVPYLLSNVKARVVWQNGGTAGLQFEREQDKWVLSVQR